MLRSNGRRGQGGREDAPAQHAPARMPDISSPARLAQSVLEMMRTPPRGRRSRGSQLYRGQSVFAPPPPFPPGGG
eukprot:9078427-Alexandrium_andersonii.AAC.1